MWTFRKKRRDEKIRNPIQGEFFATEAIEGPAQALVRESIQNSLDAAAEPRSEPVRVRIFLGRDEAALHGAQLAPLFKGAWAHYKAKGNGLRDVPDPEGPCPYLVVEDFGTKGLTGDPAQSEEQPGPANPFFLFLRAEGLSGKEGLELGRWGVGKFVFPRSSQVSTHFGVTVRSTDKRRFLFGAITLKAHRISGEEGMYSPDALYGVPDDDGFVMPIEDRWQIDEFSRLFRLERADEPGLSVVVPYVDPDITFEGLLQSAVKDYFLPVLAGKLIITVADARRSVKLTADSLAEEAARFAAEIGKTTLGHIQLARWMSSVADTERIVLAAPDPRRAARWSNELVSAETIATLRGKLSSRVPVAVRVPLTVREKGKPPITSYFDMYLEADGHSEGRPLFVREGIIISDVRGARVREVRSLVVVEDRPLAAMLGDSENPAHTQWQKDSSNFKGKYTYGKAIIDFVTSSVAELFRIIAQTEQQPDPSLTVDFFSLKLPEDSGEVEETEQPRHHPRPGHESPADPSELPPPRPSTININRIPRGFSVQNGSYAPQAPYLIEVRCAYDVRSGNPLKRWNPADFQLGSAEIAIEPEGDVVVKKASGNWLLLQITGSSFGVRVTGFDEARDVFVRARVHAPAEEGVDADQAA